MIDNYYEILELTPKSDDYKIAFHYKKLCKKQLVSSESKEQLYKINCAFEVLGNENIRQYYVILYRVLILHNTTKISSQTIDKYLSIIDLYELKAKKKTDKMIEDNKCKFYTNVSRSLIVLYLIATLKLYSTYPKFTLTPLAAFAYIIIGAILLVVQNQDLHSFSNFMGIFLLSIGIIIQTVSFRKFTIDLMSNKI